MKNRTTILLSALAFLILFPAIVNAGFIELALSLVEKAVSADAPSDSKYLCCAIAIDTSQAGPLLRFAGFLIGLATAALLVYKIWAGVRKIKDKDTRRALGWACGFSEELLITVDPPSDSREGAQEQGNPRLLQRELIASVIRFFGEFLKAVRSRDEDEVDRIKGHLGTARKELEEKGWTRPAAMVPGGALYFLYSDDEDDRSPPAGSNWRATGKRFKNQEEGNEYCRKLLKGNPRIGKIMFYDYVYGDWTSIHTREEILGEEKPPEVK